MTPRASRTIVIVLLLMLWGLLALGSRGVSLTMDEPYHFVRGYVFLSRGQSGFWYFSHANNPPLVNVAQGSLIYMGHPEIPLEDLAGWGENFTTFTDAILPYFVPIERTEVLVRAPSWLLAVILGAIVFRWAALIGGKKAGCVAVLLLVFDPLFLANSRLATADLGVTALGTATLYTLWLWYQSRTRSVALLTGVLVGLTLLTKYSAVIYAVSAGITGIVAIASEVAWRTRTRPQSTKTSGEINSGEDRAAIRQVFQATAHLVPAGLIALFVLWAGFLFAQGVPKGASVSVPAPMFWNAVVGLGTSGSVRITVLFGNVVYGSRWWYFPLNFIIKNPIPLIGMFLIGLLCFTHRRIKRWHVWHLVLFPVLYTALAMAQGINVSYRHMLPVHPFLDIVAAVGLAGFVERIGIQGKIKGLNLLLVKAVAIVAGVWYVVGTLCITPHELAYFNELVGGPEGAPSILVDYTQDWGQYYKALSAYLEENPGPRPQVFVFTPADPSLYRIQFDLLEDIARYRPRPGRYVLGPGPIFGLVGTGQLTYDWFRHQSPTATLAHALYIYDVGRSIEWVAQCTNPVETLDEQAIADGFQTEDLRKIAFDCMDSWIYPAGDSTGQSLGSYTLHDSLLSRQHCRALSRADCVPRAKDRFVDQHLSRLRLAYEQREYQTLPAFSLYETEYLAVAPTEFAVYPASASTAPRELQEGVLPVSFPQLGSRFSFLGLEAYFGDDSIILETWWRQESETIAEPFSIFAHLITVDGAMLDGDDGNGVSHATLVHGDVIVQRHEFHDLDNVEGLWVRMGVYWARDPDKRWEVVGDSGSDGLFAPLTLALP